MSKVTIFCPACSEPNSEGTKNCVKCGEPLEGPSKDFIEEINLASMKKVEFKDIFPGIKAGLIAGTIAGLAWGLIKICTLPVCSVAGYTMTGIIILPIYLIFNIICGVITGSILAFFGDLGDIQSSQIKAIIVNIIISILMAIPWLIIPCIATGSIAPIFLAFIAPVFKGFLGGGLLGTLTWVINKQYLGKKY